MHRETQTQLNQFKYVRVKMPLICIAPVSAVRAQMLGTQCCLLNVPEAVDIDL